MEYGPARPLSSALGGTGARGRWLVPTLTQQEQDDLLYVLSLVEDGGNRLLDFSDDRQYRVAIAMQNLGGHTPETRPGMHAALAELRERHIAEGGVTDTLPIEDDTGFQSGAQVTDVSAVQNTTQPASTGFAGFVAGAWQLNATIAVNDFASGAPLAHGSNSQIGQGQYLPLYAAPDPGAQLRPTMTGSVFYASQVSPGGPWIYGTAKRDVSLGIAGDPQVDHPVQTQRAITSNYIRIALGRGQNTQTDVDYWYWYNQGQTIYAIPWVGYVDFDSPPLPPTAQNVDVFATLARDGTGRGGYARLPQAGVDLLISSLRVSGNRLAWTLRPPADRPPWGNIGQPLIWGDLRWNTGEADYVTIQLWVALQGQRNRAIVTVQSSDDPDRDPLDGTRNIPRLQFLWSCLAAGTPVRLADGSQLPIEDVERGTVVACGDGEAREVFQTTAFHHVGDALRVATDGGHELLLSHNHPVATPDGLRQAHELEVGGTVNVAGGTAAVTSLTTEPFDGLLCNLSVSAPESETDPAASTVYAAGVEVGDYETQIDYDNAWRTDPERILALLEPRYHPDYRNLLAERSARA